jgi:hypothetical protein
MEDASMRTTRASAAKKRQAESDGSIQPLLDPVAKKFILARYNSNKRLKNSSWEALSLQWQSDTDVAFAALTRFHIKVAQLPAELQNDRDFMMRAVARHSGFWTLLSDECSSSS